MTIGRAAPLTAAIAIAAAAGAALGAWVDWHWWNPVYGMQMVLILGCVLLLAAATIAAVVSRRTWPFGLVAVALVGGVAGGLSFGPSRETPEGFFGTMTLAIERPSAAEATWSVQCSVVPSGAQFIVTTGESQRVELAGERRLMSTVSRGDMWHEAAHGRPDALGVWILVIDGGPLTDAGPTEHAFWATASSTLEAAIGARSGSIRFAGLVPEPALPAAHPLADLAGTITWNCDTPSAAR